MDYPNRQRLKLLGHIRQTDPEDSELLQALAVADYRGRIERGFVIEVAAFDWNCPQHITPRFTQAQMTKLAEGDSL
jgi:predicted pyridoxine 5'-phosphate oxidase superfamily flavin-nucleotide-binding protein